MSKRNKCIVCGEDVTGKGKCAHCGKPVIINLENDDDFERNSADDYRARIFSHIPAIGFTTYLYDFEGDNLKLKNERDNDFASTEKLYKSIVWSKQEYPCCEEGKALELNMYAKLDNGDKIRFTVNTTAPDLQNYWAIGLKLDSHLKLHLYVGDESNHSTVENIKFLNGIEI